MTTTVINQTMATTYGVPATAFVVGAYNANLLPNANGSIRVNGYATSAAFSNGDAALINKNYIVPSASVATVFASGVASIITYLLTLPDFTGATTTSV